MIIEKLLRLGGRQLHTIMSRETIKPSSTTPYRLQTYNLSWIDQLAEHSYQPLILFYPNNAKSSFSAHEKAQVLKKSLSESLTHYYPFAGRLHTHTTPYVDCNDQGVVFVEAKNGCQLETFQHIREHDATLDQLFTEDMVNNKSPGCTSLLGVQLNHFACGGLGVAVSMSHIIGDGCTLGSFLNHWSSVARYGSVNHKEVLPLNPHLIQSPRTKSVLPQGPVSNQGYGNRVTRTFMFPNTKLSDLKNKVIALASAGSTKPINNPTRVEVLTSLLYKTAMAAATTTSGCFKPSSLFMTVDLRNKFVQKLPQTTFGNFSSFIMVPTRHETETSLNVTVAEIKKQKSQLDQGVENVQYAADNLKSLQSKFGNKNLDDVPKRPYVCTSVCGFPFNKVDFGWGKPKGSTFAFRSAGAIGFILKDTPDGDGIEALVILEKEDMEIFENDKEMLSFC